MTPAASRSRSPYLDWQNWIPLVGLAALGASWGRDLPGFALIALALVLGATVLAAVHHAEIVAHKVGEPLGSIVLALAVTIIEVGLIITLMTSGSPEKTATLARDTVFAAAMITMNIIVGLTLWFGLDRKRNLAVFNREGTATSLGAVVTVATLCLVLPTLTTSDPGPYFTKTQLAFAAVSCLTLYVLFVITQTSKHRDFFLPAEEDATGTGEDTTPPSRITAVTSLTLLIAALVAVVGLAKVESPAVEAAVAAAGLPHSFVGVVIALVILLPETLAAVRNARRRRVQVGLNLAYGSAMASIGLTVPVMAVVTLIWPAPLALGLDPLQIALLTLTAVVSIPTIMAGRAPQLQAAIHLVVGGAFVVLSALP